MSSRSLAAARARRAGESAPPVSGNRPGTSIASHAAFAPASTPNVRVARSMNGGPPPPPMHPGQNPYHQQIPPYMPPPQQQQGYPPQQQAYPPQQQYMAQQQQQRGYAQQQQQQQQMAGNNMPFSKLSVSDAIGLITLRLGRVEQWVMDSEQEREEKEENEEETGNHGVESSVITNIIARIDALEKTPITAAPVPNEDIQRLKDTISKMGEDLSQRNIEMARHTEQVLRYTRELTETKDMLKSFMIKYDSFCTDVNNKFLDYEAALQDIEQKLPENAQYSLEIPEGSSLEMIATDIDEPMMEEITSLDQLLPPPTSEGMDTLDGLEEDTNVIMAGTSPLETLVQSSTSQKKRAGNGKKLKIDA